MVHLIMIVSIYSRRLTNSDIPIITQDQIVFVKAVSLFKQFLHPSRKTVTILQQAAGYLRCQSVINHGADYTIYKSFPSLNFNGRVPP